MEAFMQALDIFGQNNQPVRNDQTQEQGKISEFKKLSLPSFAGTTNPLEAEKWLTKIQKAFSAMSCIEQEKATFVAYMLQGYAYDWWLIVQRQHEKDNRPFTWKMFAEAYSNKYFPKSIHQNKEREFIKLEQGSRTVIEYEAEFARLAKFAPNPVATKERRVRRFEEGLMSHIKQSVIPFELTTYIEVVSKSLLVERAQLLDKEENKAKPSDHKFNGGNSRAQTLEK